ncbi:DUF1772 domain-containing protein [Methylorubrum populi]|uniref:DUF1772 domain-containing protein n=1 Tax=Methylorubrum rhodesianum TaxID=29427 RepID=A0ABU9ZGQ0_9HYPH|nr:DUF1772 domain-containing protein [Methylorubrum rhodesianum]MBK3405587.1 DUF1772 domain-containing protein [Methylorubrum rhodesianum]MBY0139225.1 DUF1772 domain-containing protein [Methylorubrum populi]
MIPALLALVIAALFTGAALYILVAEQPARLLIPEPALLVQWRRAYHGGTAMQGSLAVLGFLCAALAWWLTGRTGFLAGGLVLVANWPYTLIVIMPVNRRLEALEPSAPELSALESSAAGQPVRALVERWGHLHAGRLGLGGLALLILFWTLASLTVA